jgi:hypothetical protein
MMENFPSSTKQQCSLLFSVLCTMYTVVVGLCPCFGNPQGKKNMSVEKKRGSSSYSTSVSLFTLTFLWLSLQFRTSIAHLWNFIIIICVYDLLFFRLGGTKKLIFSSWPIFCCCCLMNNLNRLNSLSMESLSRLLIIIKLRLMLMRN